MGNCTCVEEKSLNSSQVATTKRKLNNPLQRFYQSHSDELIYEFQSVFQRILCNKGNQVSFIRIQNRNMTLINWEALNLILGALPKLNQLSLKDISINENISIFSKNLQSLQFLEKLVLKGCQLNDRNIQVLCESIIGMKNLKELDLTGNQIAQQGIDFLCMMLPELQSLEHIYLRKNNISNRGLRKMARCLCALGKMQRFVIDSSDLSQDDIAEIRALLPRSALI